MSDGQSDFALTEQDARQADLDRELRRVREQIEITVDREKRSELIRRREAILDDLGY